MEDTLSSLTKQPWWQIDHYSGTEPLVEQITDLAGPNGVALVKAWPDGRTDIGWGLIPGKHAGPEDRFMPKYNKGDFNAFAIVMRSVRLVCIDIDGKNGGFEHAKKLGLLPPTLAETSKSGNGYHLFYYVNDTWDENAGYDGFSDYIGIEQGVDIRSVGCVYHHEQQRWNWRAAVPLPKQVHDLMQQRKQRRDHDNQRVTKILEDGDPMEMLMLQDELMSDLKKPIAPGKRNTTLFAIGQKMKDAQIPDWQDAITERGHQVGLDIDELDKLVKNIETYN
jgi:hypothetical protein